MKLFLSTGKIHEYMNGFPTATVLKYDRRRHGRVLLGLKPSSQCKLVLYSVPRHAGR